MIERVRALLFEQAAMLDAGDYAAWLALLTEDCTYEVPVSDALAAEPGEALFHIQDDPPRLRSRVAQLMGRHVVAEQPRTRTRRFVSNLRLTTTDEGWVAQANLLVRRIDTQGSRFYSGRLIVGIVERDGVLRIRSRRVELDDRSVGNLAFLI
jgi:p-cumate 2,3-dioxygenase beta subunit